MKYTNRQLINELLPVLQKAIRLDIPELDCVDCYGLKYHARYDLALKIWVVWQQYGDTINLEAKKLLPSSKYDYALLSVRLNDTTHLTFAKEFCGKGIGFYAVVNWDGKIIESELD